MKTTKLLLLVLSCMLVIGCKRNNADEPTPPTPQYPNITMDSLKSYFPYKTGDRVVFRLREISVNYTVNEATFVSKDNKIIANISMDGSVPTFGTPFHVKLAAEVTDNHILKTTFSLASSGQPKVGSFEYDTAKKGVLPDKFNYSCGAIVEKNIGLTHYLDVQGSEWDYFNNK
jgi:hypothetical protein